MGHGLQVYKNNQCFREGIVELISLQNNKGYSFKSGQYVNEVVMVEYVLNIKWHSPNGWQISSNKHTRHNK